MHCPLKIRKNPYRAGQNSIQFVAEVVGRISRMVSSGLGNQNGLPLLSLHQNLTDLFDSALTTVSPISHQTRLIHFSEDGRVHWLVRFCIRFHSLWCQMELLAYQNWKQIDTENGLQFPSSSVRAYKIAFRSHQYHRDVPTIAWYIFYEYEWKICPAYLNDVIIVFKSFSDHLVHLDEFLSALRQAGVTLQLIKCELFTYLIK